ncbi:MAG: hypothetical protein IJC61_03065 [Oscillospiraceae bacterium]|nr:hypothetical protein [Oscillospiraceae bacterium]
MYAFFKSFAPDEVEALFKKYPNVKLDLAPGWQMFEGFAAHYDKWHRLFRTYSDRFVFATDASLSDPHAHAETAAASVLRFLQTDDVFETPRGRVAHGIKLEPQHLENILYKNHDAIVGETPRPINKAALRRYIERYLSLMPDSRNRQLTEQYYRKNLL